MRAINRIIAIVYCGAVLATALAASAVAAPAAPNPATDYRASWLAANGPYKRALLATRQGQTDTATRELQALKARWEEFRTAFRGAPPAPFAKDGAWRSDLDAVATLIARAERELRAGKASNAHHTLEEVGLRWMETRSRQDVCTFGDHLMRFHGPMESVVVALRGKTAETLTQKDVESVRKTAPEMLRLWLPVLDAPANGLPSAQSRTRTEAVRRMGRILAELDRAAKAGDRAAVIRAGAQVQPVYEKLYLQFG